MDIDQSAIKGEQFTGYEGPQKGPFACSNCEYFRDNSCGQKIMMAKSQRPKLPNGRVKVDPLGCCEYIDRLSKKGTAGKRMMRKTDG